jgi:hypothetical protein
MIALHDNETERHQSHDVRVVGKGRGNSAVRNQLQERNLIRTKLAIRFIGPVHPYHPDATKQPGRVGRAYAAEGTSPQMAGRERGFVMTKPEADVSPSADPQDKLGAYSGNMNRLINL